MKRAVLSSLAIALLLHAMVDAQGSFAQATGLTFYKNFFITGDYVVAGVNMRGTGDATGMATQTLDMTGVDIPAGVDLAAAFLYWETVSTTGSAGGITNASFQGNVDPSATTFDATKRNDITGLVKVLNPAGTAPCWSSGGGTGSADGAHLEFSYRADVLRFIPIDPAT